MTSWAERIRARMQELGLTQDVLARHLGITRGAITHYLSGRRVPPLNQFKKLAAVLKTDPAWLQFGATGNAPAPTASKVSHHRIPILTWEQAAEFPDISKLDHSEIKEWVVCFYTDQPSWYALRVKGTAMTSLQGQRSYHDGDIIIVDPNKVAVDGSLVIAMLPKAKEATFKQYVMDGGIKYLKPLNPQYPLTEINESTQICGVIVGSIQLET